MGNRTPVAVSATASDLAANLRTTLGRMKRRLREHGGRDDLTPSQISVLLRLEKDGPATVSGLARAEGMRPQSMSSIVTSLQSARLVRTSSDPSDRRQTLLSLSKHCEILLRESRAAKQDWLTTTILRKLSTAEQHELAKALQLLNRLTDDAPLP